MESEGAEEERVVERVRLVAAVCVFRGAMLKRWERVCFVLLGKAVVKALGRSADRRLVNIN